ncbi:MAG: flagellar hook capping protein [Hyphomicrobiales bacterium]|nr:flagellar hook capping protein [Hyphomicrobiales bacterium]
MIVTPTSVSTTAVGTPAKAAGQNTVNYNSFLKLMVTQMQNQDPTAPMDSSQFLSQLASFSGVEQAVQSNSKLDALISMTQITQANGLIGKTATSADGLTSGVIKSVRVDSNGLTATLANGASLNVASGITLSSS